jgi:hypothetical protein
VLSKKHLERYQISLGVETHLHADRLKQARKDLLHAGWTSHVCPAQPSPAGGSFGGEWAITAKGLDVKATCREPNIRGWASVTIRMKGGFDLLFISLYLVHGNDPYSEVNYGRLESLARFLKTCKLAFIVAADWNCTPDVLESTTWPGFVGGRIKTPSNINYTCRTGKGALLDYLVVSADIWLFVTVAADLDGPWSPHFGLCINLDKQACLQTYRGFETPMPIPRFLGPVRTTWESLAQVAQGQLDEEDAARSHQYASKSSTVTFTGASMSSTGTFTGASNSSTVTFAGASKSSTGTFTDASNSSTVTFTDASTSSTVSCTARGPTEHCEHSIQQRLTFKFLKFSRTAELHLLDCAALDYEEYKPYLGRGTCPVLCEKRVVAENRVGSYYHCPQLTYISTLHQRVLEFLKLRYALAVNRLVSHKQYQTLATWICAQGLKVIKYWPADFALIPEAEAEPCISSAAVVDLVMQVLVLPVRDLKQLELHLLAATEWLYKEQIRSNRVSFKEWLTMQLKKGGAKAVHSLLKQPLQKALFEHLEEQTVWGDNPVQRVDAKAKHWSAIWAQANPRDDELAAVFKNLEAVARQEQVDMEHLTLGQLTATLNSAPAKTGLGTDQWSVKAWASLPAEAKVELLKLLRDCERSLTWPAQLEHNVIALVPKPTGGERPIALTVSLYRLWGKMRKHLVSQWEDKHHGFWDTAIRGSSPLRAALIRELKNETCA